MSQTIRTRVRGDGGRVSGRCLLFQTSNAERTRTFTPFHREGFNPCATRVRILCAGQRETEAEVVINVHAFALKEQSTQLRITHRSTPQNTQKLATHVQPEETHCDAPLSAQQSWPSPVQTDARKQRNSETSSIHMGTIADELSAGKPDRKTSPQKRETESGEISSQSQSPSLNLTGSGSRAFRYSQRSAMLMMHSPCLAANLRQSSGRIMEPSLQREQQKNKRQTRQGDGGGLTQDTGAIFATTNVLIDDFAHGCRREQAG